MLTRLAELYVLLPADEVDEALLRLSLRVMPDDVEVRTPQPGRYRRLDERFRDDATGTARSGLRGAVIGAVVGVVVALLVGTPGNVIGLLAFGFALFGAIIAGMAGLQHADADDDDPIVDVVVEDPDAERLLVVLDPHQRDWARKLLEEYHGARALESDVPVADHLAEETEPAPTGTSA